MDEATALAAGQDPASTETAKHKRGHRRRNAQVPRFPANAAWLLLLFVAGCALFYAGLEYKKTRQTAADGLMPKQAYTLPAFKDFEQSYPDFHAIGTVAAPAIQYDVESAFAVLHACQPVASSYSSEADLRGGRMVEGVPIRPGMNVHRLLRQEYEMRVHLISQLGLFFEAAAMHKYAQRQLALYRSVEKREQERVKRGLAPLVEQIGLLQKVIDAQHALTAWHTKLQTAYLATLYSCRDDARAAVATRLKGHLQ